MDEELIGEWLGLLRPWVWKLQRFVTYEARDEVVYGTLHDRVDYLRLNLGDPTTPPQATRTDDEKWQQLCELREAIELVALAVHYKKRLWLAFHEEVWNPHYPFLYDIDSPEVEPRWQLGFAQHDKTLGDSRAALADAVDLFTRIPSEVLSPEYVAAKIVLKDLVGDKWDDSYRIPMALKFESQHMDQDHTPWISIIHELVRALSDPESVAGQAFCLDTVSVSLATLSVMAFTEQLVTSFIQSRVAVPELVLCLTFNDAFSVASTINTTSVIGPEGSFTDHRFVDELVLQGSSGPDQFANWCSAVARAQCLRRLCLRKAFADQVESHRALQWRWLAYALSNRHWRSSIRHLRIEEEIFRVPDADNFISSGEEGDNAQPPDEEEDSESRKAVQLFPRSLVRLTGNGEKELEMLGWTEDDEFLVLSEEADDDEWMPIIVPGFGRCWTQCESVANVHVLPQHTKERNEFGLLSLQFHVDQAEPLAIPLFVRNVGATLTHLSIHLKEDVTPVPTEIRTMLRQCPVLEFLSLRRFNVGSMDVFRDAYRAGECRVNVLSLWNVWVDNPSLKRFAQELGDCKSKLSFHLREFRYIFDDMDEDEPIYKPDQDGIEAFLTMMRTNKTLSFLEIGIEEQIRGQYLPRFASLDNQQPVAMIPAAAKMALLSVVTPLKPHDEDAVRLKKQKLKQDRYWFSREARTRVLPLIWSFLAAMPTRKIIVSPTKITANTVSIS